MIARVNSNGHESEGDHAAYLTGVVHSAMRAIAVARPVFYSEADFQHAFAWQLQSLEPTAGLRLEMPLLVGGKERLDVFFRPERGRYAIELKYPRAKFQ